MMENVDIDGRQIRTEIVVADLQNMEHYQNIIIAIVIVGLSIIIW